MVIGAVVYATAGGAYADVNQGGARSLTDVAADKTTDVRPAPKDARRGFMTKDYATEGGGGVAAVSCPDPAECPASTDMGTNACVNQNCTKTDNGGQVACSALDGTTTENGFARCFDFVAEGVSLPFNVDVVKWGVGQLDSTSGDTPTIEIRVYSAIGSCPPLFAAATLLGTAFEVVSAADVGQIRLTPMPAGIVINPGEIMVVEIFNPTDGTLGTPGNDHGFRPISTNDACSDAYIRTVVSCGPILNWLGVSAIGFPDSQYLLSAGGNDDGAPDFWNICGDTFVEGCEQCDPPDGVTCDENCRLLPCGDGVLDEGEECDPPEDGACPREVR